MISPRAVLAAGLVFGSCALYPETVTSRPILVSHVDVVITGHCTGTPCSSSVFDLNPLGAPSSNLEGSVNRNPNGELVITVCDLHPTALAVYRATRVNMDGGTERFEGLGGGLSDSTFEVNTQYRTLDSFDGYSIFNSLYSVDSAGQLNFAETPGQPHDLDPVSIDGGTMVFEYKPVRYIDPDGGFLPTVRQEYPFTFTETHRVSTGEEIFEEHYSECPREAPRPYNPGFY